MSFKEIRGQTKAINLLKNALEQKRLASAYLFIGEEGIGKRLVAKNLAKAVNCLDGHIFDSCDQCISCRKIEELNHPDVHWIYPQGSSNNIKIEQVRQLKNEIALRVYEAEVKVFIIDKAESLTAEATNAFLKILEEPEGKSLIILITSKPKLIFPTILSRCQKLRFSPLGKMELEQLLLSEFKLNKTLSHYLSYYCEGSLGEALSLSQKDILKEKNRVIDQYISSRKIHETKDFDRGKYTEDLNILASWFRDIYFMKVGMPHAELINLDRKSDLLKAMSDYTFADLDSLINYISDNFLFLEQNANLKLLLSNLKIKLWKK